MTVFPNTRTWEQQEQTRQETEDEGKQERVKLERSKVGTK